MVPKWLENTIDLNHALEIILRLWECDSSDVPILKLPRMSSYGERLPPPRAALPAHKLFGQPIRKSAELRQCETIFVSLPLSIIDTWLLRLWLAVDRSMVAALWMDVQMT